MLAVCIRHKGFDVCISYLFLMCILHDVLSHSASAAQTEYKGNILKESRNTLCAFELMQPFFRSVFTRLYSKKGAKRIRADELLLERGLVETRSKGQILIQLGRVWLIQQIQSRKPQAATYSVATRKSQLDPVASYSKSPVNLCTPSQQFHENLQHYSFQVQHKLELLLNDAKLSSYPFARRLSQNYNQQRYGGNGVLANTSAINPFNPEDCEIHSLNFKHEFQKTEIVKTSGQLLHRNAKIFIEKLPKFVGRAGEKLEAFLDEFSIDCNGKEVLDVGASIGGFTDCCLQRGAERVVCIDVGTNQLDHSLKWDSRVTSFENINARYVTPDILPYQSYDVVTCDISFISIVKVLCPIWGLVKSNGGMLIALIKPQFEATRSEVSRGKGIIRSESIHSRIMHEIWDFCTKSLEGGKIAFFMESAVKGACGNKEYFIGIQKK